MKFADLRLAEPILRALVDEGYTTATPIQAKAIPPALEGQDVLGCAQTGTGKTAAFALPIIQRLAEGKQIPAPRCLVLAPTRELATQIAEGFNTYGRHFRLKTTTIFGGVSQHGQVTALRRGVDVVVATPGRLLDLVNQRLIDLRSIQTLVLDEADRMLDMGFINDIRKIVALVPAKRQTLMFSATMPFEIRKLADQLLHKPATVTVTPVASVVAAIDECVYFVEKAYKPALLAHLYEEMAMARTIVFTRTKHGADKVVKSLTRAGIRAEAIHGNKSQNARQRALDNFKSGKTPMLVATDIASRGIDVDMITHVVNFDLTHEPESYVHRVGRTGRAGQTGVAIAFCDREERENLRQIEKLTKRPIRVVKDMPTLEPIPAGENHRAPRQQAHASGGSRGGSSGSRGGSHPRGHSHGGGGGGQGGHRDGASEGRGAQTHSHPAFNRSKPLAASQPQTTRGGHTAGGGVTTAHHPLGGRVRSGARRGRR